MPPCVPRFIPLGTPEFPSPPAPEVDPASPLLFVINAASGRNDREATRAAIEASLREAGRTGELLEAKPDAIGRLAQEAAAQAVARRTAVIAVGGDGTLNAVANAAHARGCAMGVVPRGTFNYFARTHGLPVDAAEAVSALVRAQPVPVQVGTINDRLFLVNASLGLYPQLLEDRETFKQRFGRRRWVAVGAALFTLLGRHRQLRLRIELTGEMRDVTTPTLFVGNNRLQLKQVGLEVASLGDGRIAAVMLRPIGTLSMFWLLCRGAFGTLGEASTVESFQFQSMVVRPRGFGADRLKVAMDGEVSWLRAPVEFRAAATPLYLLKSRMSPEGEDSEQAGA